MIVNATASAVSEPGTSFANVPWLVVDVGRNATIDTVALGKHATSNLLTGYVDTTGYFATIQAAVDASQASAEVRPTADVFAETVTLSHGIQLLGVRAGEDARTRDPLLGESTVSLGLRIRACGEHPHAAETLGIDVIRTRYLAVVVGGLIAGLAGAWFSLETQGGFEDNMTSGAGFIALAALIFGKWKPWTAFAGAMLFGFSRALGTRLQILGVEVGDFSIPSEFWQSLPFVVTIIVVAGAIGRAIAPAADGQPYQRSR